MKDYVNDRNRTPVMRESNGLYPQNAGCNPLADSCSAWLKDRLNR